MTNRYYDLLSIVPKGQSTYTSLGEVLPYRDSPHSFVASGLTPGTTQLVSFNGAASSPVVVAADGTATILSVPKLKPGEYTITLTDSTTQQTKNFYATIKNMATIFAALSDVISSLDSKIDDMNYSRSLQTATSLYIQQAFGQSVRQPTPSTFDLNTYRNLLRQLRQAYRHYGAITHGVEQAVNSLTSVNPLRVPKAWYPHWVLGTQLMRNGDFQQRSRLCTAEFAPAGSDLLSLNRQSRYFIHPGVGTSSVVGGFRAMPSPQPITATFGATGQTLQVTGLDDSGTLIAETIPDPSVSPLAQTYQSINIFSKVLTAIRTGSGGQLTQIGLADTRFVEISHIGANNRPGVSINLSYAGKSSDGNPSFTWGGGSSVEAQVFEPTQGYGLTLTAIANGIVVLADVLTNFTASVRVGYTITITGALNANNNGTFPVVAVALGSVQLTNPLAVDENSPFHWVVNTGVVPYTGNARLLDVDRRAIAVGRIEQTNSSTAINLDPGAHGANWGYFNRLYLELNGLGVCKIPPQGASASLATWASAINTALNTNPSYSGTYVSTAFVITGTEGDNKSVLGLRAPSAFNLQGDRSTITFHPGPADAAALIFGQPLSSTYLTANVSGYTLTCSDTSRMPPTPFEVRIRGLRLAETAGNIESTSSTIPSTTAKLVLTGYVFASNDIGGHVYWDDTDHTSANTGMHRILYYDAATSRVVILHENAATGGMFNFVNTVTPSNGSGALYWKGQTHNVIGNASNVLTLDPTGAAPAPWLIGSTVELVSETPYQVAGTPGQGSLDIAVDTRYRPMHDFGDSISFVSGTTWRITSLRGNFTGQVGALLTVQGCQNVENNSPTTGFTITAVSATTADFVNSLGIAETSNFEWSIDVPNSNITDSIEAIGATMPDGWQVLTSGVVVKTCNNDATATDNVPSALVASRTVLTGSGTIQIQKNIPNALQYIGLPLQADLWFQEHSTSASGTGAYTLSVSFDNGAHYAIFASTASGVPQATLLSASDTSTQFIGVEVPTLLRGTFYMPWNAQSCLIQVTRTLGGSSQSFSLLKMDVTSPTGSALVLGTNTIPRSQKRTKFGELLYVWSAEPLIAEEQGYLGIPSDGTTIVSKPGHIDYITNAHGYWNRADISEVDETGASPVRNNIIGVYDSIDWSALDLASGLTNMSAIIATPSRMSYARPIQVTPINGEQLNVVAGGGGTGIATLNQTSNHGGSYPQVPNTNGGTNAMLVEIISADVTITNSDGSTITVPAGTGIPVPNTLDANSVQPWVFSAANQITISNVYFNPTSIYNLNYEALMGVTTQPFQLSTGENTPNDYVWMIDLSVYNRRNTLPASLTRTEQAIFGADFTYTLSHRCDTTQPATLQVNTGTQVQTVSVINWSFADSTTIQIDSTIFNPLAIYSITYAALTPDLAPEAQLTLMWRSASSQSGVATAAWVPVRNNQVISPYYDFTGTPDVTTNSPAAWHQLQVTMTNVRDVRDVKILGLGIKGVHLFGTPNAPMIVG